MSALKSVTLKRKLVFLFNLSWACLLFPGCIDTLRLQQKVPVNPDPVNASTFNGTYTNKDSSHFQSLWTIFHNCKTRKRDWTPYPDSGSVSLKLQEQILSVKLYHGDSLAGSFDLSVRQEGNYLFVKRRFFLIPIPFVFYHYREVVAVLSEERGALNVQYADDQFIWMILAGGQDTRNLHKYPKTRAIR